jgi:ADP-dependent NAD(P)H-hydrate dehydratase / NAD(P)H-hydrate epimerase
VKGATPAPGVWHLVTAAEMRALDRHTIETLGVPGELLMESAGRAVAEAVLERLEPGTEVVAVCGTGNNGGDGLVAARHLHLLGVPVRVALVGDPANAAKDAASNLSRARAVGVPVGDGSFEPPRRGIVIDAVFGTGLSRRVEGAAALVLRRMGAAREECLIVAVDLPSGLDADTGQPWGDVPEADVTVTLGLPKLGLALEPGRSLAGAVRVARIGIRDAAPGVEPAAELWTHVAAGAQLPSRPAAGHKGTFGHVLVIAGSRGKSGAAALAAEGAGRAGAGLVTIACPASIADVLAAKCTEAMTAPVPDTAEHGFGAAAENPLLGLARERDVVALGPGIGTASETQALVRRLVSALDLPLVLDADGLNALGGQASVLKGRRGPSILTPHPGEAARLMGRTAAEVNRDRVGAARTLARESGAVVVLKGAATVVASPEGRIVVNATGGPVLGTGGTGDVLTGVVAGLLAQGLAPLVAAALGVYLHGFAGDRLAARFGPSGVLAGEVAREFPRAAQALRRHGAAQGELVSRHLGAGRTRSHEQGFSIPFPQP